MQLKPRELATATAGRRVVEGDVFAVLDAGDHAGPHLFFALGVAGHAQARIRRVGGDDGHHTGFHLLADQLGVVVVGQVPISHQADRQLADAAHGAGPWAAVVVDDLAGRHAHALQRAQRPACHLARVLRIQPVGNAAAELVEFFAEDAHIAVVQRAGAGLIEVVRFEQLDLHRDGQAVTGTTPASTDQNLSGTEPLIHQQSQQAGETVHSVSVAVQPIAPGHPSCRLGLVGGVDGHAVAHDVG